MGNRLRFSKFHENLFSSNEIKSIFVLFFFSSPEPKAPGVLIG